MCAWSCRGRRGRPSFLPRRAFDLFVAVAGLVLLAPLLLIIAAAVRRDSFGPALFRQVREGYRASSFTILKFRTMRARGPSGFAQARPNDPRVTRVGALSAGGELRRVAAAVQRAVGPAVARGTAAACAGAERTLGATDPPAITSG